MAGYVLDRPHRDILNQHLGYFLMLVIWSNVFECSLRTCIFHDMCFYLEVFLLQGHFNGMERVTAFSLNIWSHGHLTK